MESERSYKLRELALACQNPNPPKAGAAAPMEWQLPKEAAVHCPLCDSDNTKFCYYNNGSLNQPRYFCKTCGRYWTETGSRKKKKDRRSAAASTAAASSGAGVTDGAGTRVVLAESSSACGDTGATVAASDGAVRVLSEMELLRSTGCYATLRPAPTTQGGVPGLSLLTDGSGAMAPGAITPCKGCRRAWMGGCSSPSKNWS